jgi:cyclomaltodextrinase
MAMGDVSAAPPAWVADAVVYQVFPDRFRRSGRVPIQESLALQPWGSDPRLQGFHGGDLYGVIEALDHLQGMGVTCLYLTPVFSSAANHRYHAYDYLEIDPLLGGDRAFDALIHAVHGRGMRLILDGVFNHCGRGFWAFHHLLENGAVSPYRHWFHVHHWPLLPYPRVGETCGYSCWWNDPALPKFNHHHPAVQEYLLRVGRHWLERGIDGWRLDVPDEVPQPFWQTFRRMVKAVNRDAWIVGEIWGDARPWLQGDQFDGVMNYRMGWSSLSWAAAGELASDFDHPLYPLRPLGGQALLEIWQHTLSWYRPEVRRSQLNLLDSHDVPRALHSLRGDRAALKLALVLLFLQPGAPCVYYGTEAGLAGGPEPGCREGVPWGEGWRQDLQVLLRDLAGLRRRYSVLRHGVLRWRVLADDGLRAEADALVVVLNRSRHRALALSADSGLAGNGLAPHWQLGTWDPDERALGPQSVVVFSDPLRGPVRALGSGAAAGPGVV